mmetsp:Transcript_40976/g.110047  ORF Transcript_40976/g.110047 Transcript_40976/m.110047 type:complete len:209 (-) Transcript_40976:483-1109(-)
MPREGGLRKDEIPLVHGLPGGGGMQGGGEGGRGGGGRGGLGRKEVGVPQRALSRLSRRDEVPGCISIAGWFMRESAAVSFRAGKYRGPQVESCPRQTQDVVYCSTVVSPAPMAFQSVWHPTLRSTTDAWTCHRETDRQAPSTRVETIGMVDRRSMYLIRRPLSTTNSSVPSLFMPRLMGERKRASCPGPSRSPAAFGYPTIVEVRPLL